MRVFESLSAYALRPLFGGAVEWLGIKAVGSVAEGAVEFLAQRFLDQSQRLNRALRDANERAWKTLEIALAGESFWERCRLALASGEDKAFRRQLRTFLDKTPALGLPGEPELFRRQCLSDLRMARKRGLLKGQTLEPLPLAQQTAAMTQFDDPGLLLDAQWRLVAMLAGELHAAGLVHLGTLLTVREGDNAPLLLLAVRYFFRRAVEQDPTLSQGLEFAKLEQLGHDQEEGFGALHSALTEQGARLESLLEGVQAVVARTHAAVLDLHAQLAGQTAQLQQIGGAVLQLLEQHQLQERELRAGDSLSLRTDGERRLVKKMVAQYRALPENQRRQVPALLNAIGKLEVVAGDLAAAEQDFQEVAGLIAEPAGQAEAHANRSMAALERKAFGEALTALQQAAQLDPERFAPFPLHKFEPVRILGAGGFGVAFLCRNRHSGSRLVIKTLLQEGLDRSVDDVFREARALEEIEHPAIIRLRDCDFADAGQRRPYLVMDYFEGPTLADFVAEQGPVSEAALLPLAIIVAEGLAAAHARGILHRDVKPGNLLVRRQGDTWQAKLIDFGLALQPGTLRRGTLDASTQDTVAGTSMAGTLDYAAPEQLGRLSGIGVGPVSDVYSFGKTCCFALFGTPQPTFQHWQKIDPELAELLGRCLAPTPAERPAGFLEVLAVLQRLRAPVVVAEPAPMQAVLLEQPPPLRGVKEKAPRERREPRAQPASVPAFSGCMVAAGLLALVVAIGVIVYFLVHTVTGELRNLPATLKTPAPLLGKSYGQDLDKGIAELKSKADGEPPLRVQAAANFLATPVLAERKEDVAAALKPLLSDQEPEARIYAAKALGKWGTPESVPPLVGLTTQFDGRERWAALDALADLQDERGTAAIAKRLTDGWDRQIAPKLLIRIGPPAEKAVLAVAAPTQDVFIQQAVLKVLKEIGGQQSVPLLESWAKSVNLIVKRQADETLAAVKARLGD